ncbi:MAG: DUF5916 domain-containing protein [Acidobacteriota bacterium]|jgi:hypothetical protein
MRAHSTLLVLISVCLLCPQSEVGAQDGNYRLGQVIGLRYFKITKGDPEAYARLVQKVTYPFYDRHVPGVDWVLMKGDRGEHDGDFAYFFNFVDLERRNLYFPDLEGPRPEWDAVVEKWDATVGRDAFRDFELDDEWMGDYVLLGAETVKEMPWLDLLGIHHIQVKLGQEEAFERFVTERWNPNAHLPGWWVLIYKPDRGPRREYLLIFAFEDRALRDRYFPTPGERSEEGRRALLPLEPLWAEMNAYLDAPLGTVSTDFVLIRQPQDLGAVGRTAAPPGFPEPEPPRPVSAEAAAASPPTARAVEVSEPPVIDGDVLNDSAWQAAEPITGFWQTTPDAGEAATEATEVRVLYTTGTLYVGVVCYDREPSRIIIADSRRDPELEEMDSFQFILDTYRDRQNGFMFGTNPTGVEYDAQVSNEGQGGGFGRGPRGAAGGLNVNWDGSWTVRAQIGDFGWSAEFAIPFRTLRFSGSGTQTWGLNFERTIRRKRETAYWAPLPRQYELPRVSRAGTLEALDIPTPRNLQLMPYVLGQGAREATSLGYETVGPSADFGGDLKYSITPSLTLDATYRTDFAQVEVDEQQVNLDRFNLFFPEKRPFFLENAGVFAVGQPGQAELFFSRRIGLGPDGEVVPIIAGARVSGDAAGMKIGLLNMQTEAVGEAGIPANNFGVVRLKREMPNRSFFGGLFTNRQGMGDYAAPRDYNRLLAVDGQVGIGRYGLLSGFAARSFTPGRSGGQHAFQLQSGYDSERWLLRAGYTEIGEDFNPEIGFLRRSAYRAVSGLVFHRRRPDSLGLHEWRPGISYRSYWGFDGLQETGDLRLSSRWEWNNGYELGTGISFTHEGVREQFSIVEVVVPEGSYDHVEVSLGANTDASKRISLRMRARFGGYFGGELVSLSPSLRLRSSEAFQAEVGLSRNDIDLPGGSVTTNLIQARLSYSFTPRLYVQALLQYNDADEVWSTNLRLGWLQAAGTGLFVVFNQTSSLGEGLAPGVDNKTLVVKYSRLINLLK